MTEKLVYDGFNKVYEVNVEVKGEKRVYEKIERKDGVAAIVVDEDGKIAIVTQYRPIVGLYTKEIPAGMNDKPKSKFEIMLEELEEECDIKKDDIINFEKEPVIKFKSVATGTGETSIYEFKVKNQADKEVADADVEKVEWFTIDEIGEMIKNEKIVDSKTIIAYYYLKDKGEI